MSWVLLILSVLAVFVVVTIMVDKKQKKPGIMREGKLLKS